MIVCPNCRHKEMLGAVFCSECGAQLVFDNGIPTGKIKSSSNARKDDLKEDMTNDILQPPPITDAGSFVSLKILNKGEIIPVRDDMEVTLGRVSEGQPVFPDVDLTPYQAYEAGVSRLHASISKMGDRVSITDLGSANGTRINGQKISSQIPHPINHGDILTLGKLKMQVLIRKR